MYISRYEYIYVYNELYFMLFFRVLTAVIRGYGSLHQRWWGTIDTLGGCCVHPSISVFMSIKLAFFFHVVL